MASDTEIREGVKKSLEYWIKKLECGGDVEKQWFFKNKFIDRLKKSDIAENVDKPNEQHYEVPTEFFLTILGKRLKYSACCWPDGVSTIEEAEEASLKQICERAQVEDGQSILDLGCGWGSLSLYILEKYPSCKVTSVSNSQSQRRYIQGRGEELAYASRLDCITADANHFQTDKRFDRIISIEMFEHMRNYERLFQRVSTWLKPSGLLFTQILCHREFPYAFDSRVDSDTEWMAKHFFTGGTMPSADLFLYFQNDVVLEQHWRINGKEYMKTLEAWLQRLDKNKERVSQILNNTYGTEDGPKQLFNWRMFFMFCSEVFGYQNGNQWMLAHHLFRKRIPSNV